MDHRHLELLRELAERGTVTAVAQATHRTPSAVSQQLRTAQREFGVALVEPEGRGLRLTEAGQLLAAGGRELARVAARIQADWDAFRGSPSGRVTVAALPSAATVLLPGVLRELSESAIEVECVDVDVAETEYAALVRDHDVVIAHSLTPRAPAGTDGLVTLPLAREPLDLALDVDHPLAAHPELTPEQVGDQEWIGVPVGFPFDTVRLGVEAAIRRPLHVVQRVRDNRLAEALIVGTSRVAVLPRFTSPQGSGVVLRPLVGVDAARFIFAIGRPDRVERLAVRTVLDALRRQATRLAPDSP
ncbi:LysR family transcriptional regulator [Nocardioides sp. Bht2]|uniref:LysR family transcriptional regulator n=1 Tax=Nocardioides sp. Bht2 TaxID=3392297 RepID=UPI0039B56F4C